MSGPETLNSFQMNLTLAVIEAILRSGGDFDCRLYNGANECFSIIKYKDYEIFIYGDEAQVQGISKDVRFENYRGRDHQRFESDFIKFVKEDIID